MKILLLSWNYPPVRGGIEYVVENLFLGLSRAGQEVQLVTSALPLSPGTAAERGQSIHRCSTPGLKEYVFFSLSRGTTLARDWQPDVILCGSLVSAPAAYLISRRFGIPYAVLVHGSDILLPGWLYQTATRYLLRHADVLFANSTPVKNLLTKSGHDPARIRIVHPGVRVEDYQREPVSGAEEILKKAANRRVILSVGRLIKRKGVIEFVTQVMPELARDMPDVLLLIVGDDATRSLVHAERLKDVIARKVSELNLVDHVKLLGTLADAEVVRLMFRAEVFVMPCLDIPGDVEGFGIVFLEAALAGTPSVATKVGGIVEAVIDGETGLLAAPGDWPGIGAAVRKLLHDEPLRQQLACRGEERARKEFAWEVIIKKYVQALARLQSPTASS